MKILKKQRAIDIFEKYLICSNNSADMCSSIGCKNCEYDVTDEEFDKAVNTAIFYLKELIRDEVDCERVN